MNHRVDLLLFEKEHTWNKEGWFLPLSMALDGVTAAQAAWQPQEGGNSIWATLHHLNYYNDRYLARFIGKEPGPAVASNTATFAIPSGPDADAAWQAELEQAHRIAAGLRAFLAELTDEALEKRADLDEILSHLILHEAYHSGQVVMLRKQQGAWPATREWE